MWPLQELSEGGRETTQNGRSNRPGYIVYPPLIDRLEFEKTCFAIKKWSRELNSHSQCRRLSKVSFLMRHVFATFKLNQHSTSLNWTRYDPDGFLQREQQKKLENGLKTKPCKNKSRCETSECTVDSEIREDLVQDKGP